ncbi:MAG: hypothetical protein AAB532_01870 [Patescibacteria group bacterium]
MSKKELTIKEKVMDQIKEDRVTMRPKWYFIFGSILMFLGLLSSVIVSVFLLSITKFALRTHGPMGQYRLEQLLDSFPWWAPILTLVLLIIGIYLLKKYDFSYRKNFVFIIISLIITLIIAVFLIDGLGLNDFWFRNGPMRDVMRQYIQESNQYPNTNLYQGVKQRKGSRWNNPD